MEEFKEITEIIRKTPSVLPPDDFAARVMGRIAADDQLRRPIIGDFLTRPRLLGSSLSRDMGEGSRAVECFFYFMLTGFAHLILALVLFLGMRDLHGNIIGFAWLKVQPVIVFLLADWFFIFGVLIWRRPQAGLKAARIGIFIYLEVIAINGALLLIKFGKQLFLLPFWGLTAGCLIIGGCLALMLSGNFAARGLREGMARGWRS